MMRKSTCPYLGLKEDEKTTLNFASPGNYCHHARPVSPVKGEHQNQFCLTGEHINCPVYRAAQPIPMPVSLAAPEPVEETRSWRKTVMLASIPVLIAVAALLSTPWNDVNAWLAARQMIPNTGGNSTLKWSVVNNTQVPAGKVENNLEANPAADTKSLLAICPMPSGWTVYEVKPTDSLYRLSVIYGVDIAVIQKVNCFGNETAILPGQKIYLPLNQLKTPTTIPSVTPFPTQQFIPQPSGDDSADEVAPTDVPSTDVPPAEVAPKDPPKDNTKNEKPKDEKPKDKGKGKGKGKGG